MDRPTELLIDRLGRAAASAPHALLLPGRDGDGWPGLTNGAAWARSGAVASWLIAQGFGPGERCLAVHAADSPERAILLLGALRAGALLTDRGAVLTFASSGGSLVSAEGIALAALARCSVDAAVAERRRHIDAATPARRQGDLVECHGDVADILQAVTPLSSPWTTSHDPA